MDGITFQKLRDIEARFAEVEASMADPAVAQDPAAYQKLARESKESRPVVERYRAYKEALQELATRVATAFHAVAGEDRRVKVVIRPYDVGTSGWVSR